MSPTPPPPPSPIGEATPDPAGQLEAFRWTNRLARALVADAALASEINQDAWATALERFGDELPPRRWWTGTLRSLAFRARRGGRRRRRREALAARPETLPSAAELSERSEAQQRVAAAVLSLDEPLRVAVQLRFQEGFSGTEIAERLGLSKSTVSGRIARGLEQLRARLQDDDAGDWSACLLLATPLAFPPNAPVPPATASPSPAPVSPAAPADAALVPATSNTTLTGAGILMGKTTSGLGLVALAALAVGLILVARNDPAVEADSIPADHADAAAALPSSSLKTAEESLILEPDEDGRTSPRASAPAVPPALEEQYLVAGRVVDGSGEPVPNPVVRLIYRDEWRHTTTGDASGSFRLALNAEALARAPDRDLSLEVLAGPHLTVHRSYLSPDGLGDLPWPRIGVQDDLGTVTLQAAGSIEGRAVDRRGKPIAGAVIGIYGYDPESPEARSAYDGVDIEPTTDAEGRFVAAHILPSTVKLRVRHALFLDDSIFTVVTVTANETAHGIRLTAAPAEVVTGTVTDVDGLPIAGAYVNGTGNWSYLDTARSDEQGRFQLGLRKGSPARIEAFVVGMTQVAPDPESVHGEGEVTIVLRRNVPLDAYEISVIDEETRLQLSEVGVRVVRAGEDGSPTEFDGQYADPMDVPAGGLRLDYAPGLDRLAVSAPGYEPSLIETLDHAATAPHLTIALNPRPSVRGRLLLEGQPLANAHVVLRDVDLRLATPREALVGGRVVRGKSGQPRSRELGLGGYSPLHVLGLDGMPPADWTPPFRSLAGQRTDDEGRFHFENITQSVLWVTVREKGEETHCLGPFDLQSSPSKSAELDLGDLELTGTAQLTGRFSVRSPWDSTEYYVDLDAPKRRIDLDADGSFRVESLRAGDTYFRLRRRTRAGADQRPPSLIKLPTYHLRLAPGEERHVELGLDEFRPCTLELELTINGQAPPQRSLVSLTPLDGEQREYSLRGTLEGTHYSVETRALGPCRVSLVVTAEGSGWTTLRSDAAIVDLQAGALVSEAVGFSAGSLGLLLPAQALDDAERIVLDLEALDPSGEDVEISGIVPDSGSAAALAREAVAAHGDVVLLETVPFAPGRYRGTARRAMWGRQPRGEKVLATFEVTIVAGERALVLAD